MIYVWSIAITLILLLLPLLKKRGILKCRLHFKRVALNKKTFTSKPLKLTFNLNVPFKDKALYDHVLKAITYHAPIPYSKVNIGLLKNSGIDITLPVYIEINPSYKLLKKLLEINKKYAFNLIIFTKSNKYNKYLKHNKNLRVLYLNDISKELKENLYKLNINYNSCKLFEKTYNLGFNFENFILKEHFEGINLVQTYTNENFEIELLKNKYKSSAYVLKIKNISNKNEKISFNFNYKFSGYYLFNKKGKILSALNLLTENKMYFYSSILPKGICFSSVNGLKNSKDPLLAFNYNLSLKAGEIRKLNFAYGSEKNLVNEFENNNSELKKLFNIKIQTDDNKLNTLFNITLPRKIALSGVQNFNGGDYSLNEILTKYKEGALTDYACYNLLKQKFIIEKKESFELQPFLMNYKLKIFFEDKIKTIEARHGEKTCLSIDDILYYNARSLSKSALKKSKGEVKIVF